MSIWILKNEYLARLAFVINIDKSNVRLYFKFEYTMFLTLFLLESIKFLAELVFQLIILTLEISLLWQNNVCISS